MFPGWTGKSVRLLILIVAMLTATSASARDYSNVAYTVTDTGAGFSVSVPDFWTKGVPAGNTKFIMGSAEDDFAVFVTNFGPAQSDRAGASAVYRDSFLRQGMTVTTESDVDIAGRTFRRYVLAVETPEGAGHAEAVMLAVGDEAFAVVVVTPAAQLEPRRAVIGKILGSIQFK